MLHLHKHCEVQSMKLNPIEYHVTIMKLISIEYHAQTLLEVKSINA
jgi:hypothetical protein